MTHRLIVICILLITSIYNVKSQDTFYSNQGNLQENTEYFLHTVERGQTVYSLSTMYNVPVEDIHRLNPGSETVIRIGDKLKIPQDTGSYLYHTIQPKETLYSVSRLYEMQGEDIKAVNPGLSIETFTIGRIIRIPTNKVTTPIEDGNEFYNQLTTNNLLIPDSIGENIEKIRVALLLPFGLKEGTSPRNASQNRYVEYYEGFLLAINDLKKQGINLDLHVFDTGLSDDRIFPILEKPEMESVNLLIGGQNEKQIKILSNYAATKKIPYVIPVVRSDEVLNNYYAYQVNTPLSYINSKTSLAFCDKFRDANVIFYTPQAAGNKMDLVSTLQSDMKNRRIDVQTATTPAQIAPLLDPVRRNVFVLGDDSRESLAQLIGALKTINEAGVPYQFSLFGHPAWQSYSIDFAADFYQFNSIFYTTFYANPTDSAVKNFYKKYSRWYSREMINTYPKYGMLGYDTASFFLRLIQRYGTSYDVNVNNLDYRGIQTSFSFDRVSAWGGFINTNVFFIEYTPDYKIISNPVD